MGPYFSIFYLNIFTRWICEVNPRDLLNVPFGVPVYSSRLKSGALSIENAHAKKETHKNICLQKGTTFVLKYW